MPRAIVNGDTLANISGGGGADRDFGDGSLGDVTIMSSMDLQGELPYNSLVVNDGVRVSAVALTKLTIRTRGNLTLNGSAVIDAHGRGYPATSNGGDGGEGGADSAVTQAAANAENSGPTTRALQGLNHSGAGGGGGGGGACSSPSRPGGDGGYAGNGLGPLPPFGAAPRSLIGRLGPIAPLNDEAVATIVIPASTLVRNGDSISFLAGGSYSGTGAQDYQMYFDGVLISDNNQAGPIDWRLIGTITRISSTEAQIVVTPGDANSFKTGDFVIQVVDWSLNIPVEFQSRSTSNAVMDFAVLWHDNVEAGGATTGGTGGTGGGTSTGTASIAGTAAVAAPLVDATLRARIETHKDYRALSSGFWGSPGGSGGGGGGGTTDIVDGASLFGPGGSIGSQAGPTGFGTGGSGSPGVDLSTAVSRHGTGGGGGGAGGAGGGDLEVWCGGNLTIGTGSINANGGNGGDGGRGGNSTNSTFASATGGGGGGGGGGSGGTVLVVVGGTPTNVNTSTVTANGGNGGLFGPGGTTDDPTPDTSDEGSNGASGRDGNDGFVVLIGA